MSWILNTALKINNQNGLQLEWVQGRGSVTERGAGERGREAHELRPWSPWWIDRVTANSLSRKKDRIGVAYPQFHFTGTYWKYSQNVNSKNRNVLVFLIVLCPVSATAPTSPKILRASFC